MKKLVYLCIIMLFVSCNSTKKPIDISMKIVSKGNLYGNGREGISKQKLVIKTEKEWKALKEKMNVTGNLTNELNTLSIDFDERILLAIFDEQRTTGGHSIAISQTEQTPDKIMISIKKSHPDGMATTVMTQPYCLATIAKTDKKIVFEEAE